MRFITAACAASLLVLPAAAGLAQTTTPPAGTEPPAAPAAPAAPAESSAPAQPETAAPSGAPTTSHKTPTRRRQTMKQRFAAANTSKDGRLTLDQAKAAKWSYVTRHFSAIDKDHKGYVTTADIQAYARAARAARHRTTTGSAPASAAAPATPAAPDAAPAPAAPAGGATSTPE